MYSLRKYLRLAVKGNPTVMLPQYAPDESLITMTPLGRELRDLRSSFLSRQAVPIFVLTRSVPDEPAPGHARYVTDVREAAALARQAAGDRDILLHGAEAARAFLQAGELDEMALQIVPVLLGQGRRLFDDMAPEHVELELVRALESPGMLHTRYRVRSADEL